MKPGWLWALLGVAATVYLAVAGWRLAAGPIDADGLLWLFVAAPAMPVGGAIILLRRPGHRVGVLLALTGIAFPVLPTIFEAIADVANLRSGPQEWMWAAIWVDETSTTAGVALTAAWLPLLPHGRTRYARERRFVRLAWMMVALPTLTAMTNEVMVTSKAFPGVAGVPSGLFVAALEPLGNVVRPLTVLGYVIVVTAAIGLLFLRYRAAPVRERKQIRWVLFAGSVAILSGMVPSLLAELDVIPPIGGGSSPILWVLSLIPFVFFPASVVIAVLEPPWADVDIVIRRSFVYGALSVAILLAYVAVATVVGVTAGSGLGLDVEVAVLLAVVIALLFQPARRRLQALADRWVFGTRPTKYEAVAEFGATIAQASDPDAVLPQLLETIRRALRLEWAQATLDDGTDLAAGAVRGEPVVRVPVGAGDEQIGEIACGPKIDGAFDDDEVRLVRTLAGQLGLALMNARLAGRIVNTAESERRRIERNIHDGAQQELVALVARLGMAGSAAANGRLGPGEMDDLRLEAQRILVDLRELAQGIHPSVLSDGGILEAVEERCTRLPIQVSVTASDGLRARRFDDDVEGAAYFFVSEALANTLKHAHATRADVSLAVEDHALQLVVVDNGVGFDADTIGHNGLAGIRDRIRALGGTITVGSWPGTGTRIAASLPVEERP